MTTPDPAAQPGNSRPSAAEAVDRLVARIDAMATPACVGLDPVLETLPDPVRDDANPVDSVENFSRGVVDAVAGEVPIIKIQSACFERYGSAGWAAMERIGRQASEAGLFVLLDAKRGDISVSARHYAEMAVGLGADAITINPYLGPSSIAPFLEAGLFVFALCRTSNPDSDALQAELLDDGSTVAQHVASMLRNLGEPWKGRCGLSALGAVVAATKSEDAGLIRGRLKHAVFLAPGIGAQGATAEDAAQLVRPGATSPGTAGLIPTASRSVLYTDSGTGWQAAVQRAAAHFAAEAARAVGF